MQILMENGTFQAILEMVDEVNMCKLIKSHMPITNRNPNGPEEFLSKMMIGRTCRLEGPIRNWMRTRNRYGRPSDFQVQLKKVIPKQSMDDLLIFAFTAVGALWEAKKIFLKQNFNYCDLWFQKFFMCGGKMLLRSWPLEVMVLWNSESYLLCKYTVVLSRPATGTARVNLYNY